MPTSDLIVPMADVCEFADTPALIANLDLVISVDISVVHLAGAMGTPVFLLERYANCWRWLSGREDSRGTRRYASSANNGAAIGRR